jgi:hypothetical protein
MEFIVKNKIFVTLVLLCISSLAYSADFDNCKVVEIIASGQFNAHAQLDCQIATRPACAIAGSYFGFNKSTEEGKIYMSLILTAFASGSPVTGYVDDNNCSPYQGNVALLTHLRVRK